MVVIGGVIPAQDYQFLYDKGASAIFGPGTVISDAGTKLLEILIVGIAAYIPLGLMGLNHAATLSIFVGLSVIIPYVGAIAVTIPVALIAWFQFGPTDQFLYIMIAYLIVQALDANVLVPLLFSEVVNMHPVAIIVSVLVFGGLWGVWGVFFAIPLATLVQAVINAWPRRGQEPDPGS